MKKKKKRMYYQYDFADVYGREWQLNPLPVAGSGQLNIADVYDGSVLGVEALEQRVERRMRNMAACRIMHQRIISGEYVESNVYPVYLNRKDIPRAEKGRTSRETQKNLNRENRRKKVVRLMNANFCKGDLIVTLTYKDGFFPDLDRARKDMKNYLESVRRYRKKQGMTPLKYIYVIEYEEKASKKIRIHHHLIMSKMDRDIAESKWKKGRVESRYADPDEDFGLEGFASYITKLETDGRHLVQCSRNLKKPIIRESVTQLTKRKMRDLALSGDGIGETMEKIFCDTCRFIDSKVYVSDITGGFYIYSRLKRREVKRMSNKENALSEGKTAAGLKPVKIYINMDWKGTLQKGTACYSVVLETEYKGAPYTTVHHGTVKNTTKNRAVLHITRVALSHLPRKYNLEIHAPDEYLAGGFNLCRFQSAKEKAYQGTKNADLIDKLLKDAAGHAIRVVPERSNTYTEWTKRERERAEKPEEWEKTIDDKR